MRRSHYLVLILLLICQTSFGQIYQNMAQPGYKFSRARFDSVLTIPTGLGNLKNISGGQDTGQIRFNKSDSSVYVWNGRSWIKPIGGGVSDTLKVSVSDTAAMLTNYSRIKSIGLTMPAAFSVANSPLTSSGTLAVTGSGTAAQYVRGDGQLATFPNTTSGGSSVSYYLNGSVNASVAGYKQMANTATIGGGTDFTLTGNGLIAQFLTDAGNPNRIQIPGGAWNFEMFFQVSSSGGNQKFYVELLKYDGTTFTTIASSSLVPEEITGGTAIDLYLTSLAVPTTTLLTTDRLAIRVYIVDNAVGRTVTLHTEDNTLCEIITTFAGGVSALNGLTANTQYFATGTSGTDFNISSATDTHTLNLPTASATNTGKLSSTDWSTFNSKLSVTSYGKNATRDSTILLLSNGTRYAAKDSVGSGGGASGWGLTGNASAVTDFLGTTNNRTMRFRTNNIERMVIDSTGRVGIGTATAAQRLDVNGTVRFTSSDNNSYSGLAIRSQDASATLNLGWNGISSASNLSMNNTATEIFLNAANGRIGLATNSPTVKLQLNGTSVAATSPGTEEEFKIVRTTTANSYPQAVSFALGTYQTNGAGNGYGPKTRFDIKLKSTQADNQTTDLTVLTLLDNSSVGIGTTSPNTSSLLDVTSTTQGLLIPRMTLTQRNSIATPAAGLQVYNTDQKRVNFYDGAAWQYSPTAFTGTAAPTTTPLVVGDTFTDTVNKKMYVSTGTASSADWTILN